MKVIMLMVNKHRLFSTLIVLTFILSGIFVFLAPKTVYAAETGAVIDRSTIKIGDRVFFDGDIDTNFKYEEKNPTDSCADHISGFSNDSLKGTKTPSKATLVVGKSGGAGSSKCNYTNETITFTNDGNFAKAFVWIDENTVGGSDGKLTFKRDGKTSTFVSDKDKAGCRDTITVAGDNKSLSLVERVGGTADTAPTASHGYDWYPFNPGSRSFNKSTDCWEAPKINGIQMSGSPEKGNEGSASGSASGATENQPSCESEGGESSWILCSALRIASSFLSFIDEKLNSFLTVPSSYYASPQVVIAWERMRNIAYLILVPVMLVMVISTALGFEFISAYTFKKALPRMFVAVLFIALSLEITKFLVILTNELGQGVLGLVTSAFNGASDITLASLFNPGSAEGALFTGGVIVGGALAIGIIPVLLLYLASAGLALAIAVFALAFRQMLLIAFMILAPIAIIAWIFPGNDKLWKLWWGAFSKLLLIFPLIMFLIGSGRAFAALVQDSGSHDFIATILILAAYIGPFFFIPAMFKFAGGIFGTITGMVNDRGKGAFDRLRGARKKGYEKAWHRAKEGNYYKGGKEGNWRQKLNTGIMGGTLIPESGLHPARFKENMTHAMGRRDLMESEEFLKTAEGRQLQDDDIAAATEEAGGDEAKFRKILADRAYERFGGEENADAMNGAVASWKAMSRRHGAEKIKLAALRSRFNSSTGWNNEKVYKREENGDFALDENKKRIQETWTQEDFENGDCTEGQIGDGKVRYTASGDMLKSINNVSGGNRLLSTQLLAEARAGQTRAGRDDTGGAGYSDTAIEMDRLHRGDKVDVIDKETGKVVVGADGKAVQRDYTIEDATKGVTKSFIKGKNVHEIFRSGKGKVAEAVAPVMLEMTTDAINAAESKHSGRISEIDAEIEQISTQPSNVQSTLGQQQIDAITADPSLNRQEKLARIQAIAEHPPLTQQAEARVDILRAEKNQRVEQQTTEVIRTLAQEQMKHSVAASSSADVARIMGDQVFNKPISLEHFPQELQAKIFERTKTTTPTRGQVYDAMRDDPVWGAYTKEYGVRPGGGFDMSSRMRQLQEQGATAEAAQAQAAAEARAAQANEEADAAARGPLG